MRIQALTRHAGVSFNGGPGYVHLRAANADPRVLRSAWDDVVVQHYLGGPLRLRDRGGGEWEGSAPVFPFVPLVTLSAALRAACAGRPLTRAIADELAISGGDARMYDASYGLHARAARRRGWVVQPLLLGFYPALLVGAGRHARFLVMNTTANVSSPLTLAGINKAIARDLLASHGLPVAPGALATSPDLARRVAQRLGGPVVIKRLIGGNSDGVIVGVSATRDVTSAAKTLLAGGHAILVESLVTGTELRLHFLAGRLHRAFRAEPYTVTGDGRSSLIELIEAKHPRYLAFMSAASAHRRRLVMSLWGFGVRTLADMARTIPAHGRVVRVSAATGAGMERVDVSDFIPRRDISRLERFLSHHGSPSCGMDVIVHTPGAPFDEAGAILELNVPCGFAYLDDPRRAVAADLDAAIAGDATFRRDKGRIPVWLVMEKRLAGKAEAALRKRYDRVAVGRLDVARSNWVSLVNQPDVDALVVIVSEEAILAHGIPVNLAPLLVPHGDRATFPQRFPATYRTVKHAKGRLGTGRLLS
jgi:hypothetical protein